MYELKQLQELALSEEALSFDGFSRDDAFSLASAVYALAHERRAPICCQVVLDGFPVVRFFLDGTDESNIIWLTRKKNSVYASGGWSSLRCGMEAELNGVNEPWHNDTENYVIRGGGVPIRGRGGELLGALCVSGLMHLEDHQLAMAALRRFAENKERGAAL